MIKCSMAIVVSLLCLAISGCQSAPTNPSPVAIACERPCDLADPKIVFDATEHDFGKIDAGTNSTCSFEFINDGGKDLVIEKVHASCGCTTTNMGNTTLKPGQASEIEVTYHAPSYAGKSKKRITVHTNDPQTPQIA